MCYRLTMVRLFGVQLWTLWVLFHQKSVKLNYAGAVTNYKGFLYEIIRLHRQLLSLLNMENSVLLVTKMAELMFLRLILLLKFFSFRVEMDKVLAYQLYNGKQRKQSVMKPQIRHLYQHPLAIT